MALKHLTPRTLLLAILLFQTLFSATSSLVVVGRVFCDTCLEHQFSETSSYFIPGALVAVECSINRRTRSSVSIEGETDEYGEFRVEIPSAFRSLNRCSVRMVSSPDSSCNVPSTTTSFAISNSKVNGDGDGTYDAGSFRYRPPRVPPMCYESTSQNYVRGRAALEEPHVNPELPRFNFPPFPFPFPFPAPVNPGSHHSLPPFPFTFPTPPAAEEGHDSSKANAESPPTTGVPPFPKIPQPPNLSFPPLPQPPPLPLQFPPIPFLTPSPPPPAQKAP